jgi:DNA-binding MarR family transcriptional regulator
MQGKDIRLNPQILGQAENAHRALLEHVLAGTGVRYGGWVALSVAAGGGGSTRTQILERMSRALRVDRDSGQQILAELATAKLLEPTLDDEAPVNLTEAGHELHRRAREELAEIVSRIYSEIPPEELATAGRVLVALTARAESELTHPNPEPRSRRQRRPAGNEPADSQAQ